MRIRLLPAAAIVVLVAAAPPAAASAGAGKRTCAAKGAKTVAQNRHARVFTTPGRGGDEVGRLYACLRRTGRRVRVDTATDDGYTTSSAYNAVRLTGRYVAWQHSDFDVSCKADCPPGYDPSSAHLRVHDLRTRRTRRVAGELGEGTALVLARTGAIAWIQPGSPVSVRAADATGARVLYAGDDIDGGSLTVRGTTVGWIAGGTPMSAELR
jgi:hypothetical protein